ncbi:PAS domain-containing protein [Candidatus Saccharibacteria bacterium]|nr:PAS domain-containing protein [Candidatus Saccharibacteria bacterium]
MGIFRKKETAPLVTPGAPVAAQNLSELVIRSIREGVLIIDANGNIALANPMASVMIGRSIDELVGLNFNSNIILQNEAGTRIDENSNPILGAIRTGENVERRDLTLVTVGSNKTTPISLIVTPTNGANSSVVVTFRDIAKELSEERERMDFISTASHEMRTPVASIEGYLGLAMNPATATIDARAMQYLDKAHESSQHLGRLFQDLLDTTKMDDGQIKAHMEPVELVSTVKQYAETQIPNIQAKGLTYQFGTDGIEQGGLSIQQLIYANIDRDFLQEILNNLIENAIKYTKAGGITVNVKADDHNVQIIVADTGIGIPRDELDHIFQKFYRVDNSDTREIGGTGLGLALVKQRVELMNGKIWAESEQGKGSRFIVMLSRLSKEAYDQQRFLFENQQRMQVNAAQHEQAVQAFASGSAPVMTQVAQPQIPVAPVAPAPAPAAPVAPAPAPTPVAPVAPAPVAPVPPVAPQA